MADDQAERHISADRLKSLIAAAKVTEKRAAEERGALAAKLKDAQENHKLNLRAFRIVKTVAKMDAGEAAIFWRTVMLYADMLGFNDQLDLEDLIKSTDNEARSDMEKVMDGDLNPEEANRRKAEIEAKREQEIKDTLDANGGVVSHPKKTATALIQFTRAIAEQDDPDRINTGLERFSLDYPEAAQDALAIAQKRFDELKAKRSAQADAEFDAAAPKAAEA